MNHDQRPRNVRSLITAMTLLCTVAPQGSVRGQPGSDAPLAQPVGLLGGAAVVDVSVPGNQGQRYLEIALPGSAGDVVVRVIPLNIPELTGGADVLYLGVPFVGDDPTWGDPSQTYIASQLQCDPVPFDFGGFERIAVFGPEIVPSLKTELAEYAVQVAGAACLDLPDSEACWSDPPLVISQGVFCDVTPPFFSQVNHIQPDYRDVEIYVRKFLGSPTAPSKAAMQTSPQLVRPWVGINFSDIYNVLNSFLGTHTYETAVSNPGLCTCPSSVVCNATECLRISDCGRDMQCHDGFCVDACGRCSP